MTHPFTVSASAYIRDDCPMQYRSEEDGVELVLGSSYRDGFELTFTTQSMVNLVELVSHALQHWDPDQRDPVTLADLTAVPNRNPANSLE